MRFSGRARPQACCRARLPLVQKASSQTCSQRLDWLELQQENRPNQRSLIDDRLRSCARLKAIGLVLASGTELRLPFFLLQSKERITTNLANSRREDPVETSETCRAEGHAAGIYEQFIANAAISGKNYADQRVARCREPRAQTFAKGSPLARRALSREEGIGSVRFRHGMGMYTFPRAN